MRFLLTTVLAGLMSASPAAAPSDGPSNEPALTSSQRASIDALVTRQMTAKKIPGVAIEIAVGERPIYHRAYGVRAPGKPADGDTVFPIGSITKQFTAAAVMALAERHIIDLDSRVSRYVPRAPHAREITVRQLLSQTSGLADYSAQPQLQAAVGKNKLRHLAPDRLLAMIDGKPLAFRPGTRFEYSNTNYLVAAMVAAAASRAPFEDVLRQRVLAPAGLRHTSYLRTSIAPGDDVARGYQIKNGKVVLVPPFTMSWAGGAGAVASTTDDLVRWDVAFFSGRVVSPGAVKTMTTAVKSDYGYGWVIGTVRGDTMIWHNGEVPGAHSMNAYFPKTNLEIVILTNLLDANPEGLAKEIYAGLQTTAQR